MIVLAIVLATLLEQVVAVTNASHDIDVAISDMGGVTQGGLTNAPGAIRSIPTGEDLFLAKYLSKTLRVVDVRGKNIPNGTTLRNYFFSGQTNLEIVYMPQVNILDGGAFEEAELLNSIEVWSITANSYNLFKPCQFLTNIVLYGQSSTNMLSKTMTLAEIPTNCVIKCLADEKIIRYVNNSWTASELFD